MLHIIGTFAKETNKNFMQQVQNSVLIQGATLSDIEVMINSAVDRRMKAFYDTIRQKPSVLVRRKDAARMLGVSLPTIDKYGRYGILHPRHVGGRVFFSEEELMSYQRR